MDKTEVLKFWEDIYEPGRRQSEVDAAARKFYFRFIGSGKISEVRERGAKNLALTMKEVGIPRRIIEAMLYIVLVSG